MIIQRSDRCHLQKSPNLNNRIIVLSFNKRFPNIGLGRQGSLTVQNLGHCSFPRATTCTATCGGYGEQKPEILTNSRHHQISQDCRTKQAEESSYTFTEVQFGRDVSENTRGPPETL